MRWLHRSWLAIAIVGALALAVASGMLFGRDRTEGGVQLPSEELRVRLAERTGWTPLDSVGEARSGFPDPMVWRENGLCIGFERLDFPPDDRRPTLARCLGGEATTELQPWEALVVAQVRSGRDTWIFVDVGGDVSAVDVDLSAGARVESDRVHLYGTMFAIRLPQGEGIRAIEWSTDHGRYRCSPSDPAREGLWMCPRP